MNLTLSWDLFIIVFFATVMAYSFIIGKTQSVQIVIASYIAILATQGIGNILLRITGESAPILGMMGIGMSVQVLSIMKIILFIFFIIMLSVRSGIHVSYEREGSSIMNIVYTSLFGFFSAGLMVSTVLTYATGRGILDTSSIASSADVAEKLAGSPLMQIMILNQDLWFTLPALMLVGVGFIKNK